ncbi:hypothetical protein SAMN02927921_02709 [Sinomicrobium oceani]|uniref:DUF6438 domain-containing protein n=1 Tax=Sinomicrobium oceani TaxID=1150368 RepID=A0A1K1QPY0_9FLAO|nr:DUF6438 domain-containing protein [Sinomicrobium oceani]SFW61326.1 hypothetical protein SAMN02927921_02709 [Sinomicrobium oceani]
MKIVLSPLILCAILLSCTPRKANEKYQNDIQGDWVTDFVKNDANKQFYIFSFRDSLCSFAYPSGIQSAFTIHDDTLDIFHHTVRDHNSTAPEKNYRFRILRLDHNNLTLIPVGENTIGTFGTPENGTDPILLKKITPKNDLAIQRIGFYSGPCFGACPSMYMEIDSDGNMLFDGIRYTTKKGLFSGKIPTAAWQKIKDNIHNTDLEKLSKEYKARWTDDQACRIKIQTADTTYETNVYGFDKEPVALRILFRNLMEIYKSAGLQQDSTIVNKFAYPEFQQSGFPTPPAALGR